MVFVGGCSLLSCRNISYIEEFDQVAQMVTILTQVASSFCNCNDIFNPPRLILLLYRCTVLSVWLCGRPWTSCGPEQQWFCSSMTHLQSNGFPHSIQVIPCIHLFSTIQLPWLTCSIDWKIILLVLTQWLLEVCGVHLTSIMSNYIEVKTIKQKYEKITLTIPCH
jgi:hypothetical protein